MLWSKLKNAVSHSANGFADTEQFAGVGGGAGHEFATLAAMQRSAAGAEPEGAGTKRLFDQRRHVGNVGGGG